MKTNLKRVALIALLLSGATVAHGDETGPSVGDLPGYGENTYFHEDATYAPEAEINPSFVGDSHVGDSHVGDLPSKAFPKASITSASHALPRAVPAVLEAIASPSDAKIGSKLKALSPLRQRSASDNCDPSCDTDTSRLASAGRLMDRIESHFADGDYWMSSEALLWFTPNRSMPALVTSSDATTLPILPEGGSDNVQVLFGDDINGEVSGGIRLDFGKKLSDNFSVGGRFWWLGNNDDSYFGSSDGSTSLGIPYYNVSIPDNDAILLAIDPVNVNDAELEGSVVGRSQLKLWAAEAYGQLKLASVDSNSIDLIGGYSHFSISDMLSLESESIDQQTARIRRFNDYFDTENEFNGGQIGFKFAFQHGRWSASSTTKIHMGNMNQRVQIAGTSFDQTPPATAVQASKGLFALGNQGEYERDTFSFAPELNFKMGYAVRKNVNLTIGYSFIYFDNVALVGDVIDTNIDPLDLIPNPVVLGTSPAFDFNDSSLWVQGIDFGLSIEI